MHIVTAMKRPILLTLALTILVPVFAHAQYNSVGLFVGGTQELEDGFDFSIDESALEIFWETKLERGTSLRLQYGAFDTAVVVEGVSGSGSLDYLDVVASYEFDEVWGRTAILGGLGVYRQDLGTVDEDAWGLTLGVNGSFPVTRRFAALTELAYHWADFDENASYFILKAGFRVSF